MDVFGVYTKGGLCAKASPWGRVLRYRVRSGDLTQQEVWSGDLTQQEVWSGDLTQRGVRSGDLTQRGVRSGDLAQPSWATVLYQSRFERREQRPP